ncbi:alpha/beta hydrolase [Haloferula chungangensis]|uniref:Alpha/beta hydrolase n=1 Tax=Haloferula chungangensis TaxID=1048331 RepID=A0ABW2L6F2_9BACT
MPRLRRFLIRFLLSLSILILCALIGVAWYGSERLLSPPRRGLQSYHHEILDHPAHYGLSITSFTGASDTPCLMVLPATSPGEARKSHQVRAALSKRGIILPAWGEIRGTIVLLHGHTGRKEDHLPICERFCAAGFRCILVDLPGHGDNPSSIATFGKNEAQLVSDIMEGAQITFGFPAQPALLFGISQGGAIALQAAARHPERWDAVASAAAFSSLDRPILHSAETLHARLRPLASVNAFAVGCGAWCRGGMWPARISPLHAAQHLTMPAMIIHGEEDRFISIEQGRQIFDAIPSNSKMFRPVRNAGHNRVLAEDADNLYPDLCEFFLKAIAPQ